jgi:hypothetical protein
MALRDYLFRLVANDPKLTAMELTERNGFGAQAPDSPPGEEAFWVLRLSGPVSALGGSYGPKRVRSATAALWVYEKRGSRDYGRTIDPALRRWEEMIDALEAPDLGDGAYFLGAEYVGQQDDAYDDVYERVVRSSAYTISYTGP